MPDHDRTSPTLLDRLRDASDAAAWSRFESTYGDLIVGFCRRRGMQATDADDVRQEVLLKLMKSLKNFEYSRERGRFRDYLFRVTRSVLADRHAQGRSVPDGLTSAIHATGEDEAESFWHAEWEDFHLRRAWMAVQSEFSHPHLDAFSRLLTGATVQSVAETLAMTEEAVHKIKQRVRDRLKQQIAAQVAEEDGA